MFIVLSEKICKTSENKAHETHIPPVVMCISSKATLSCCVAFKGIIKKKSSKYFEQLYTTFKICTNLLSFFGLFLLFSTNTGFCISSLKAKLVESYIYFLQLQNIHYSSTMYDMFMIESDV